MKQFVGTVKITNRWGVETLTTVTVSAGTYFEAQTLLENAYGLVLALREA
jgi:hypothetical protein